MAIVIQTFSRVLPILEYGVSCLAAPGEEVCGDLHLVKSIPHGTLLAVVDGAGHGQPAALAARAVLRTLEARSEEDVIALAHHCHEELRGTRGAVLSLAVFDAAGNPLAWLGVGNIDAVLIRGGGTQGGTETLLSRPGMLGHALPKLQATILRVYSGDLLLMATDGIRSDFKPLSGTASPQSIADTAIARFRKGNDDSLVLVARYLGAGHDP
jgi:phosphoserine phosphatase RsbX